MQPPQLILASSSPRRHDLLGACAIPFQIIPAAIDERPRPHERAKAYVRRLALAKAEAVAENHPDAVVLGADTIVTIDDLLFGKPQTPEVARQMLRRLCGREHEVVTGVAVVAGRLLEPAGQRSAASPRANLWTRQGRMRFRDWVPRSLSELRARIAMHSGCRLRKPLRCCSPLVSWTNGNVVRSAAENVPANLRIGPRPVLHAGTGRPRQLRLGINSRRQPP
jgi:Maf-like protein